MKIKIKSSLFVLTFIFCINFILNAELWWETTVKYDGNYYNYYLQKLHYIQEGKTLWILKLPERMRNYWAEAIEEKHEFNDLNTSCFLCGGILILKDVIIISDRTGVIIINKLSGEIKNDVEYKQSDHYFSFDRGGYSIIINGIKYEGPTFRGASFLTDSMQYIIHFNGSFLMIFEKINYELIKIIEYGDSFSKMDLKWPKVGIEYKDELIKFQVFGIIFL